MKKILLGLIVAMLLPAILSAQATPCPAGFWRTADVCLYTLTPITPDAPTIVFNIPAGVAMFSHSITFSPRGSISGTTITVSGNAGSGYSTLATSTATVATTLTFNGAYQQIKVTESGGTAGSAGIDVNYTANSAVSGTIVTVSPNPLYPTAYDSGVSVISQGSTSSITTTPTDFLVIQITNYSAATVTTSVMDSSGNYILPPNFSMPARSVVTFNWSGGLVYSGLTASASVANSISIHAGGRQ